MCTEYEIPPSSEFDVHILTRSIMTCIIDFSVTKYVKYERGQHLDITITVAVSFVSFNIIRTLYDV